MMSGLDRIVALHASKGGNVTLERFQQEINVIFHDAEATVYDTIHERGWRDLPQEVNRLVDSSELKSRRGKLRLLDVGCGTGRSTDMLLRSAIGPFIDRIVLLDTSPGMIEKAMQRSKSWNADITTVHGTIDELEGDFDLIMTCSVLHHIPVVSQTLSRISSLLAPGGHYLQLCEPHSTAMQGDILRARKQELAEFREAEARRLVRRLTSRVAGYKRGIRHRVNRLLGIEEKNYIDQVNATLLAKGIVRTPLTIEEIWMVTDIHEHEAGGVCMEELAAGLTGCVPVAWHSYAFFWCMPGDLPPVFVRRENRLFDEGDTNGWRISSVWRLSR